MKLNWPELNKLGKVNQFAMILVATTSPNSNLGKRLKKAFPECYKNVTGPVHLSVLDTAAAKELEDVCDPDTAIYTLKTAGVLDKYKVPYSYYVFDSGMGEVNMPTDLDIKSVTRARQTLEWRGQKFFVAEYLEDGAICLVPMTALVMPHDENIAIERQNAVDSGDHGFAS